jgi:hypothetical protein
MLEGAPRTVAIVGNAPEMTNQSGQIDACDWVIRFNNAAGFGGHSGSRVTHLILVNHGGQMREWLDDPLFTQRAVIRGTKEVLFPFPAKVGSLEEHGEDGRDWTAEAIGALAPIVPSIKLLPKIAHAQAQVWLAGQNRPDAVPSTGFLVGLYLVAFLPSTTKITVHGFGFAGWDGHDWASERAWFERMRDEGRIRLQPLDASNW